MRAQRQAVRVRVPPRRAQGRAGPGHHDRRRARLLQDREAPIHHHRRARAHRVPEEHDHRRRARRGRAAGHRRQGGRARELPPPRLHDVDARHQADRGLVNKMDLVGLRRRRVRAHRAGVPRVPRAARRPARGFIPVCGPRGRQHRAPLRRDALVRRARPCSRRSTPSSRALAARQTSRCACRCRTSTSSPSRATTAASSPGTDRGRTRGGRRRGRVLAVRKKSTNRAFEAFNRRPRTTRVGRRGDRLHARRADLRHPRRDGRPSPSEPRPQVTTRLRANLFWLGSEPLVSRRDYMLKLGTARVPVRVEDDPPASSTRRA